MIDQLVLISKLIIFFDVCYVGGKYRFMLKCLILENARRSFKEVSEHRCMFFSGNWPLNGVVGQFYRGQFSERKMHLTMEKLTTAPFSLCWRSGQFSSGQIPERKIHLMPNNHRPIAPIFRPSCNVIVTIWRKTIQGRRAADLGVFQITVIYFWTFWRNRGRKSMKLVELCPTANT